MWDSGIVPGHRETEEGYEEKNREARNRDFAISGSGSKTNRSKLITSKFFILKKHQIFKLSPVLEKEHTELQEH